MQVLVFLQQKYNLMLVGDGLNMYKQLKKSSLGIFYNQFCFRIIHFFSLSPTWRKDKKSHLFSVLPLKHSAGLGRNRIFEIKRQIADLVLFPHDSKSWNISIQSWCSNGLSEWRLPGVSDIGLGDICACPVLVPCRRSKSGLCVFEMFPHLPGQMNLLGHGHGLDLDLVFALCHGLCPSLHLWNGYQPWGKKKCLIYFISKLHIALYKYDGLFLCSLQTWKCCSRWWRPGSLWVRWQVPGSVRLDTLLTAL